MVPRHTTFVGPVISNLPTLSVTFVEYNKYYQPQKAMEEPFDYSQVPFTFGMCAAENCPQASTCLRQIALKHAPANKVFLPIMNPNHIKGIKEKCDYFCSNEKGALRQRIHVHNKCTHSARGKHVPLPDDRISGT